MSDLAFLIKQNDDGITTSKSHQEKTESNLALFLEMLRDEPLDSIYDPEDDAKEGQPPIEIERAVKFSRFGAIEYMEYELSKGFMLRGLTLQTRQDINYEL